MSLVLKVNLGSGVQAEAAGNDARQAMKSLGELVMMYEHAPCGHCKCEKVFPKHVKTKQGYDYYSLVCSQCRYEFSFGQRQSDGSLFPKDQDGWQPPYQGGQQQGGGGQQQGGYQQGGYQGGGYGGGQQQPPPQDASQYGQPNF